MFPADSQDPRTRRQVLRMDPDCAICRLPASARCECEAKGLDLAVKQAEDRMMSAMYRQIREWARAHAQDYILEYFRLLSDRRKASHASNIERMTSMSYYRFGTPPHPAQVAEVQSLLKRGIDEDWQASVQRYPEVLDYFYGQVALSLPGEDDPAVRDPPLSALNGARKPIRRPSTVPPQPLPAAVGLGPDPYRLSPAPPPAQPSSARRAYPSRHANTPAPNMRYGY